MGNTDDKKLAIDLGNCYINVVGQIGNGEVKTAEIASLYKKLDSTELTQKNVIECNNTIIHLGNPLGQDFSKEDKVDREHLEHQILWAVYKIFGPGKHYIKLALGLPLADCKVQNGAKKQALQSKVKALQPIVGKVDGKDMEVHIKNNPIKVCPEGHSAVTELSDLLSELRLSLICDIGLKTTDYSVVGFDESTGGFTSYANDTIPLGLESIYLPVQTAYQAAAGSKVTIDIIDKHYKKGLPLTYMKDGVQHEFDVVAETLKSVDECNAIIERIKSSIELSQVDKYFVGGGAEILQKVLTLDGMTNIKELPEQEPNLRYFANALGFLWTL